jgi:hypothetical protein
VLVARKTNAFNASRISQRSVSIQMCSSTAVKHLGPLVKINLKTTQLVGRNVGAVNYRFVLYVAQEASFQSMLTIKIVIDISNGQNTLTLTASFFYGSRLNL